MDLRGLSSVCDFFLMCTAASQRQLRAISEHIEGELRRHGHRVLHTEGLVPPVAPPPQADVPARQVMQGTRGSSRPVNPEVRNAFPRSATGQIDDGFSWVLMDCGDLVVHLFSSSAREFYQLERLWGDATRIPVGALA